ncbi:MAG: iron ABC transporter permease [Rhizobiaceae bacterium]|nr:iron ABC transporter permease [Rhizobiaceae bacterium]
MAGALQGEGGLTMRIVLASIAIMLACVLAGLAYGDFALSVADLLRALFRSPDAPPQALMIVWSIRLPRVLLAVLVGMALAVAGAIAQAVLRNPLADPGIIGINSGAALAAMVVLVGLDDVSPAILPVAGFAGASAMVAAIFLLSWKNGTSSLRLLLIGIGLGALASAATTFLTAVGDIGDVQRAMVWMAGSLFDSNWTKVAVLAAWSVPVMVAAWLVSHHLDATLLGDGIAANLGQRVQLTRTLLILGCTLLSGAAVAAAGLVSFVGLLAPHIARRLLGPLHRALLPVAALTGGTLVVIADVASRMVIAPAQLPVGLTIALVGAPFFGWLMWNRRNA